MKPEGRCFPQALSNMLKERSMLRLIPNILASRAVQRQTAASRSARPLIRLQQGRVGGDPTTTFTKPSKLAQTPKRRVSIGQAGSGTGLELTMQKKMRFRQRKRAVDERVLEEAIFIHKDIFDFPMFLNILCEYDCVVFGEGWEGFI